MRPSLGLGKTPRYCNCSTMTPINIREKRHNCPAHKYLRYGEAIYMTIGSVTFIQRLFR